MKNGGKYLQSAPRNQASSSNWLVSRKGKTKWIWNRNFWLRSIVVLIGCSMGAAAQAQTWTGAGANDFWFNNANWDTAVIPTGITHDAIVGAPSPIMVNGNVNLNSLTVGVDGIIQQSDGQNFNFGGTAATTLTNQGSITVGNNSDFQFSGMVNNSGSIHANYLGGSVNSDIEVVSAGATVSGGGTVTLTGGNARIMGLTGAVLTIDSQAIQGYGQVGANTLGLNVNSGSTIDGNSTVGALILNASADGVTNQGTLRASGGGVLRIDGSIIDNTGGSIQASAGSTVELNDTSISAGTLSGAGSINVVDTTDVFLTGLTHAGTMAVGNNSDLGVTGTINNSGSISLNYAGGAVNSDLEVQSGGATLDGGGTVSLSGENARITGGLGGDLTIADQTIQGDGQVGTNNLNFTNSASGLIDANLSGKTMTVDAGSGGAVNEGMMRASNSGVMRIIGSSITNTGGTIEALAGSTVEFGNSTSVTGGILTGAGSLNVLDTSNVDFLNLTQSGTLAVGNNSDLGITGMINNTGGISLNYGGGAVNSDLLIQSGGATLDGGGTVTLTGGNARVTGGTGGNLTIANQTIQGGGQLGSNNLSFINSANGLIDANVSATTMVVDTSTAGAQNLGVMRASNGGIMRFNGSTIDNTGASIEALTGSTVELNETTITGGTLSGDGAFNVVDTTDVVLSGLSHSGTMSVGNNSDLGIAGTIINSGSLSLNYAGGAVNSDLEIQATGATLDGGGTVTMIGDNARVTGGTGGILMIADQTIQGGGQIGTNNLSFTNSVNGLIDANVSGTTMVVDTPTAGAQNLGVMRASNGGVMRFNGSTIDNASASIEALTGSTVELNETTITGGMLSGDGAFNVVDGTNVFLSGLTHSGTMSVGNNSDLGITGTILNSGSVSLNYAGGAVNSDLEIQATGATLDGGGTVTMIGDNARVTGGSGGSLMIADQTIQGGGQLGTNNLNFTNSVNGLIDANVSGATMVVDTPTAGAQNLGLMRASNGGIMRFNGSTIDNAGGSIEALTGSTVELNETTITSGTLSGAGAFNVVDGTNVFLSGLTHSGTMSVGNNSDLGISGTIHNTGNVSLNYGGGAVNSDLEIQAAGATLDGGGTISMFGGNARVAGGLGGGLTIANQTIQGEGNVGANNLSLVNGPDGVIDANLEAKTLFVDPAGATTIDWLNSGLLRASNGGTLNLVNSTINDGTMDVLEDSTIAASSLINNGLIQGNGLLDVVNGFTNQGLIGPGASPGTLTIEADAASFAMDSQLLFEIEGVDVGQFDLLDLNLDDTLNKLMLDGQLWVDLNGYTPTFADEFVIMTSDNLNLTDGSDLLGSFSNVADGGTLTTLGGEGFFTVYYGSGSDQNQVRLGSFVSSVPEPGSGVVLIAGLLFVGLRRKRS